MFDLAQFDQLIVEIRSCGFDDARVRFKRTLKDAHPLYFEWGRERTYWRARSAGNIPWEYAKDMGPPPPEVTRVGRMNSPNAPLFYAATRVETAFAEIRAKPTDVVQICGFKCLEPIKIVAFGELHHVWKTGHSRFGSDPNSSISRYINSLGRAEAIPILYLDAFLAECLSDPNAERNEYLLSRALAASIFEDSDIDGISFPSAQDPLGMNFAIRAESFETKMHPVTCSHVEITSMHAYNFFALKTLQDAQQIDSSGRFIWIRNQEPDTRPYFNLTKEESEKERI